MASHQAAWLQATYGKMTDGKYQMTTGESAGGNTKETGDEAAGSNLLGEKWQDGNATSSKSQGDKP